MEIKERTKMAWTNDEEALLYSLRQSGITYKVIANKLNRSIDSCKNKYKSSIWENKPFYDKERNRVKDNILKAISQDIIETKTTAKEVQATKTDIFIDKMVEVVKSLPNIQKPIINKSIKKVHASEDVGLMISDCHIGLDHSLEETGGLSEYNIDIFKKRCQFLKTATSDIVELHSKLYNMPNLHIFCLGDIVAGMNDVGEWSPTYINMTIMDQVFEGMNAIADMIYHWLSVFDNVYFYGVYGNHGRAAKKGGEKEYVNWDYVCYKFLEEKFKDNDRVHFYVPKSWWMMKEIKNHKFLIVHGDDVKGKGNAINSAVSYTEKMFGIVKDIPNYTLLGHFHSAAEITTNNGRILANGSFLSGDMYSLKNLQRTSRPEQKIFGIHDKRGVTWVYNLNLEFAR